MLVKDIKVEQPGTKEDTQEEADEVVEEAMEVVGMDN